MKIIVATLKREREKPIKGQVLLVLSMHIGFGEEICLL